MAYFKEIVTKAVIGKGKKIINTEHSILSENTPNTVLGCWVINHEFNGQKLGELVVVNGSFDVNVWYSYDGDTKTAVSTKKFNYSEKLNVRLKETSTLTDKAEIIVRCLKQPTVSNVKTNGNDIIFNVDKEIGVEIVGDTVVRVSVDDQFEEYEEVEDIVTEEDIANAQEQIDKEIIEEYLN